MTRPATHIFRLLKWGRTLARHGALRIVEDNPQTPRPVRRLCRIARFGTIQPKTPDYAGAFEAIGPAAIKLGQTLATRPDIVGEDVAQSLLDLQDSLPPAPFQRVRPEIEAALGGPIAAHFDEFDEQPVGAASIAQVYKAVTTGGRLVAVKVLRPGIERQFLRDIETFEWAAAHLEAFGGEAKRLRPRLVIANFRRWTTRELDLRREAASSSELAAGTSANQRFVIPAIDWDRTARSVLTMDWVEGIKISDRDALIAAGHDLPALSETLVLSFLRQAIYDGLFHADLHQGNLFVLPDGRIAAIDFGIMGRINRKARFWLAEILYGLNTGNYRRVAEIHFEAQYVPDYHDVDEFATALRAVGEPMRGKPVHELSVGQMLDGLFSITRDFDMETQPHLLLLQKTMVMVEGVATFLHPTINMWDISGPFVKEWIRNELGPEAVAANAIIEQGKTLALIPDLIRRLDENLPKKGGAPPHPPLPHVKLMWQRDRPETGWRYALIAIASALGGAGIMWWLG